MKKHHIDLLKFLVTFALFFAFLLCPMINVYGFIVFKLFFAPLFFMLVYKAALKLADSYVEDGGYPGGV